MAGEAPPLRPTTLHKYNGSKRQLLPPSHLDLVALLERRSALSPDLLRLVQQAGEALGNLHKHAKGSGVRHLALDRVAGLDRGGGAARARLLRRPRLLLQRRPLAGRVLVAAVVAPAAVARALRDHGHRKLAALGVHAHHAHAHLLAVGHSVVHVAHKAGGDLLSGEGWARGGS